MDEWKKAVHDFYEVYHQLKKKYQLTMQSHFGADSNWIEILRGTGSNKTQIVKVVTDSEDDALCYKRALYDLIMYDKWETEKEEKAKRAELELSVAMKAYMLNQQAVIHSGGGIHELH